MPLVTTQEKISYPAYPTGRARRVGVSSSVIRAFYLRLKQAGKPFKVRVVACIRKLLTILNQMVRNNEPWRAPKPPAQPA